MAKQPALPRLAREGSVPVTVPKDARRRAMLIPKATPRPEFIPALPDDALSWLAGTLGPPERRAMREIVQRGDLAEVDGQPFIVAPVSPATIDALAAFEAEGDDMELDAGDLELDEADNEPDCPEARRRFIAERRAEGGSG